MSAALSTQHRYRKLSATRPRRSLGRRRPPLALADFAAPCLVAAHRLPETPHRAGPEIQIDDGMRAERGGGGLAAAAAPAAGRPAAGKLPPNPSSTLCNPQQLRARQRAAEQAVAEQDAAALERLLGSGTAPPEQQPQQQPSHQQPLQQQPQHFHHQQQPQQHGDTAQPASQLPPPLDGCLSSLTLQSLLPSAQPSRAQLQQQASLARQASGWSAAAFHDTGQGAPAGLAAEPSALTTYICRLEEDASMVQRQMTHAQAGPSGRGAFPAPLRSARKPPAPGRREVFVLSKWLEVCGAWARLGSAGLWRVATLGPTAASRQRLLPSPHPALRPAG